MFNGLGQPWPGNAWYINVFYPMDFPSNRFLNRNPKASWYKYWFGLVALGSGQGKKEMFNQFNHFWSNMAMEHHWSSWKMNRNPVVDDILPRDIKGPSPAPTLSNRTTSASSRRDKAMISLASCTRKSRDSSCAPRVPSESAKCRECRGRRCRKPREGCMCISSYSRDVEYGYAGKSFPCLWNLVDIICNPLWRDKHW